MYCAHRREWSNSLLRASSTTSRGSTHRWRATDEDAFVLIGRRHLRSNNSWMHNVNVLVKGKERCTLQMHPDDAARIGAADGGTAKIESRSARW